MAGRSRNTGARKLASTRLGACSSIPNPREFLDARGDFFRVAKRFLVGAAFGVDVELRFGRVREHQDPSAVAAETDAVGQFDLFAVGFAEKPAHDRALAFPRTVVATRRQVPVRQLVDERAEAAP